MFKLGDLVKHKAYEWYCIYVGNDQVCTVLDDTSVFIVPEGCLCDLDSSFDLSHWELVYRDEPKYSSILAMKHTSGVDMFKPGDLLKHIDHEWYCVCVKGMEICSILDEALVDIWKVSDGTVFSIQYTDQWEVVYSEEPNAFQTTHYISYDGAPPTAISFHRCQCNIVTLLQAGCKCGGS